MNQAGGGDPPVDLAAAGRDGRKLLWRARVVAVAIATATAALVLGIGFGARATIHDDDGPRPSPTPTTETTSPTTETTSPTTTPEDHPPEVNEVNVSPASFYTSGCDPTEAVVSAVVTDDGGLDSVALHWSFDTLEGSTQMAGGPTFSAKLGPFESAQSASAAVTVTVEAIDTAGQVTQGPATATLQKCVD